MKPYEKRVQLGAALLDEKKPGWWDGGERKKIDLIILDLKSGDKCVLGQLWGKRDVDGYAEGIYRLGIPGGLTYGFSSRSGYPTLTRRWREEIERRRKREEVQAMGGITGEVS